MAVDKPEAFHQLNLQDEKIKKHYTAFARMTNGRAIHMT